MIERYPTATASPSGQPTGRPHADDRRGIDLGLGLIALAYAVVAAVGLPLYGDGSYYFFKIALEEAPLVPSLRYGAVLAQVPVLLALGVTDDLTWLRHAFSAGYAAIPLLSLAACWLAARGPAPVLVLFPALSLLAVQTGFSGVSELVLGLTLTWPFVLLALLRPRTIAAPAYGVVLAPLLVLLHPLAFAAALLASGVALLVAWRQAVRRRLWLGVAAWLGAGGVLRLLWTAVSANPYERSHVADAQAATRYLLPEEPAQGWLLMAVLGLGLLVAAVIALAGRAPDSGTTAGADVSGRSAWPAWLRRGLGLCAAIGFALLPVLAVVIGAGFLAGDGIRLKAGATYPIGLALMLLTALVAPAAVKARRPGQGSERFAAMPAATGLFTLCAAAVIVLALCRSVAWWTATHALADLVANSAEDCIPLSLSQPPGLQWPWMAVVDGWPAPLTALVFRGAGGAVAAPPRPIALLLPADGCARLARTGIAHLDTWIVRPFDVLDARFGPLRRPLAE